MTKFDLCFSLNLYIMVMKEKEKSYLCVII